MADIHSMPLAPKRGARKSKAPEAAQWVCRVCEHDTGAATSEVMQTIVCPRVKGGKIQGGTKRYICAGCHRRGRVTLVP